MSNILVIGDAMLDINYIAKSEKIANEYPIPVHLIQKINFCLGGASNLAYNLSKIVSNINFIYVGNNDNSGENLKSLLISNNINFKYILDRTRPTTTKNRIFIDKDIKEY